MLEVGSSAPTARLRDEEGGWFDLPRAGALNLILFYRGDWCPWCNGQLASLARREEEIAMLDAVVAGVSVDPPERNRAMRIKLRLPFPLLSDTDGNAAIKRYGAWSAGEELARPASVVVDRAGIVRRAQVGSGFADRAGAAELLEALQGCS